VYPGDQSSPISHFSIRNQSTMASIKPLRIGMFGGGTVGGGVYEILMHRKVPTLSRPVVICKICVQSLDKPRDFVIDTKLTQLTTDAASILTDDTIDCVVEVMGGTGLAKTVVRDSLKAGKAVVTANKALLAASLDELHTAAKNHQSPLAFEAAVCGGIPIIQTLQNCYSGDVIQNIMGICNGTTNYMLTLMEKGADYDAVLKEAQDLGYAEADPTADVEGHDVRAKIAILAKLAFGQTVPTEQIPCAGISQIQAVDFEYAQLLGCTIKLVGTAQRLNDDAPLSVFVSPVMLSTQHVLASARGSGNAVAVTSQNMGTCLYTGPGAGRFPTANSVVADIVRVAQDRSALDPFPLQATISTDHDFTAKFYIRIPFCDGLGIIRKTGDLAEKYKISIHSILQNPIDNPEKADFCLTTDSCQQSQVKALCAELETQPFVRAAPLHMPLTLIKATNATFSLL